MQEAVIIDCLRTAVGKAPRGTLRHARPDDLAAAVIRRLLELYPQVPQEDIDDVILGCAMPEGESGNNMARCAALRAGLPDLVPGVTINRFCSSGLQSIAMAADRIRAGSAEIILAGGAESMSLIPRGGARPKTAKTVFAKDEGPRADTTLEALARLKPVFHAHGTVTAGNSSQTSDGAAAALVMSERKARQLGLKPRLRYVSFAAGGVPPEIMGIGPVVAIPKALALAGLKLHDIGLIELNEAFACQALAVIRQAGLDQEKVNVNGGAVALGHPLGCTGAKLTATILREMERRQSRYGMVTMCVGGGQGAAGIFERI